jgi:hypothetical protein
MDSDQTLPILVSAEPTHDGDTKALFGRRGEDDLVVADVPISRLQEQLEALSMDVAQVVDSVDTPKGDAIRLTQLSVQVEVTASGGIHLIGTASVGATASMTLTFSR